MGLCGVGIPGVSVPLHALKEGSWALPLLHARVRGVIERATLFPLSLSNYTVYEARVGPGSLAVRVRGNLVLVRGAERKCVCVLKKLQRNRSKLYY